MATKSLKAIAPVPTAADFLDIVLSKTQRKTPTASQTNNLLLLSILMPFSLRSSTKTSKSVAFAIFICEKLNSLRKHSMKSSMRSYKTSPFSLPFVCPLFSLSPFSHFHCFLALLRISYPPVHSLQKRFQGTLPDEVTCFGLFQGTLF